MRSELNPYNPGSGIRPRVMGGRQKEIEAFDLLLARTKLGHPNRGMVLHGLRGVGKTVLLNYLRDQADHKGWLTIGIEGRPESRDAREVRDKLARELRASARKYTRRDPRAALLKAMSTIQSFTISVGTGGVEAGVEIQPGRADSGLIDIDLEELVEDICTALKQDHSAFGIFIDEMQDIDQELLNALVTVQHQAGQKGWPFYLIGAGLPNLPAALSEARTYAERLFDYRLIDKLGPDDARYAISRPAEEMGGAYEPEALRKIMEASGRYPYFIQEFGKAIWTVAQDTPFTAEDADIAIDDGWRHLDQGFFSARWGRATPKERQYLRAMSQDGDEGASTSQVAERLNTSLSGLGTTRDKLIKKGLIYAPEYGQIAFTVPGMAGFIHRQHDE